ncbi:uncharacterized protein LOC114364828 [Ostrinia furnacalis]|uniref:uncharacterized protein LOC114364828 n=1 Tax=Ostrinia furnacalis TaxID=93504 RepID=UPI00103ABEB2|nr:uncharacterized protein LOC114364828 [Ostrinia furnacalis]
MNILRLSRPIKQANLLKIFSVNYATQHPTKFMETQDRWREQDNVSRRWQLIYKAPMEKWLNYLSVYLTVSTTTVAGSGLYYGIFQFNKETMNDPIVFGEDVVIANSATECLVYIGAFVAFHIALKILLSKYVVRMYQDGDNYLAVFRGHMYNTINKHEFKLNEFKKLKPTLVVSWSDARFSLGSKQAILLENYFKTPEYFNYLLTKRRVKGADEDD